MKLKNKVVLITGSNRGIGKALVGAALEAGASKVYAGMREISRSDFSDRRVVPLAIDLNSEATIATAAKLASDTQILINNAGVLAFGSALESKLSDIASDFETNLYGTLRVVRALTPGIEKLGGGAVANLLSIVALSSMSGIAGYSASKAALHSITQALRPELKKKSISVHGVYPGPIDTDMAKGMDLPKTSPEETAKNIILGIESDQDYIFPDAMSTQVGTAWLKNPKAVELQFASM